MNNKKLVKIIIGILLLLIAVIIVLHGLPLNTNIQELSFEKLGSTENATVYISEPIGNLHSDKNIAIIIGVHPRETEEHQIFLKSLINNQKTLKYKYTTYKVNVTKDANISAPGRMNGQVAANKYIVPHIKEQNYNLVIDIHGSEGVGDYGGHIMFIDPEDNNKSIKIAKNIKKYMPGIDIFTPSYKTSPKYVVLPIIKSGTDALILEIYQLMSTENKQRYSTLFLKALEQAEI